VMVAPSSAKSGDTVQVTWTVTNHSGTASGDWIDAVYLVSGVNRDISAIPLYSVRTPHTLNPGDSYTLAKQVKVPAAKPGQYHILVRTDLFDEVSNDPD